MRKQGSLLLYGKSQNMSSYIVNHLFNTKQGMIGMLCTCAVVSMPFFALAYKIDMMLYLPFMAIFTAISIINSDLVEAFNE